MTRKSLFDLVKENPFVSIAVTVVFVTTTATALVGGMDDMDKLVVTEMELDERMFVHESHQHQSTEAAIEKLESWNRCDRLERRMDMLDNRIWRLKNPPPGDGRDPMAVREAETDKRRIERNYDALQCASLLAG